MRILYDGLIYASQAVGGVNRYFEQIISRLPEADEPVLLSPYLHDTCFPRHRRLRARGPHVRRFGRWTLTSYLQAVVAVSRFDVVHPTYYNLLTHKPIGRYRFPVVVTVWDMIHELRPDDVTYAEQTTLLKRRAVEAADAVICISESTRRDLVNLFNVDSRKVVVTPLAASLPAPSSELGGVRVPDSPYLLFVGARRGYKNFDLVLKMLAHITESWPDLRLVTVGPPLTRDELTLANELGVASRLHPIDKVSDRELAAVYERAAALVYPSRYEGFGIPLLEAMQCGTAVVASRAASIPEVVGDAAVLFDPDSLEELEHGVRRVLGDSAFRADLVRRGGSRARQFSWDRTAAETFAVYRSLV